MPPFIRSAIPRFVLLCALATLLLTTFAVGQDGKWRVRHKITNQRQEEGTPLLLNVKDGAIQAFEHKKLVLNIPANHVVLISVDDDVHRPMHEWLELSGTITATAALGQVVRDDPMNSWSGLICLGGLKAGAYSGPTLCHANGQDFMSAVIGGVAIAAFATLINTHTTYRCVDLVWEEDGVKRNALFHVEHKNDEHLLLEALSAVSGKPWADLAEQRKLLRQQLEKYKSLAQPLTIDKPVVVGSAAILPGEYRLVPIQREKIVELDFFRGTKVDANSWVAQTVAEAEVMENAAREAPPTVRYAQSGSRDQIAEIIVGNQRYLLTENTVPTNASSTLKPLETASTQRAEIPVLTLKMKDGRTAAVMLVTYRGQRAIRFPVEHFHNAPVFSSKLLEECAGNLYVMAERIVFDAGFNLRHNRDPFDVARTEVKEFNIRTRSMTSWGSMRVALEKRTYDFLPHFSNTQSPLALLDDSRGSAAGVNLASGFGKMMSISRSGAPMLDVFMDAIQDFQNTADQVEKGAYTPRKHKSEKLTWSDDKSTEGSGQRQE